MNKYQTGDIVLIETEDLFVGKVRSPAIVRYYDERHDAYEVNVLLRPDEHAARQLDVG